jgi:hypothetical protein
MHFVTPLVRTLTTAASVALLWTASALPAAAAPTTGRAFAAPSCEAQPKSLRKLSRHAKNFGGPLRRRAPLQFGLTDPTARLRRATRATFSNDQAAAIQNDTPAAHVDADGRPVHSLLLVGVLPHTVTIRPRSPTFSPRAPRGPPSAA